MATATVPPRVAARLNEIFGSGWSVIASFQLAHMGWEMDNDYWCIETAYPCEQHWIGTDHGSVKLLDVHEVRKQIAEAQSQLARAVEAFASVEDPMF